MEPIEKKLTVNASVEKVWKALTDPAEIEKWMQMQTTFSAEGRYSAEYTKSRDCTSAEGA